VGVRTLIARLAIEPLDESILGVTKELFPHLCGETEEDYTKFQHHLNMAFPRMQTKGLTAATDSNVTLL
jgi:hypothetical protein